VYSLVSVCVCLYMKILFFTGGHLYTLEKTIPVTDSLKLSETSNGDRHPEGQGSVCQHQVNRMPNCVKQLCWWLNRVEMYDIVSEHSVLAILHRVLKAGYSDSLFSVIRFTCLFGCV